MPPALVPAILTYNEERNIGRTLDALRWAPSVIVLDSCSTDRTAEIAQSYANVHWITRPFDSFGGQWTAAISAAAPFGDFALALDADMLVPEAFRVEFETAFLPSGCGCGIVPFHHYLLGHRLRGTLLRPQLRLFRPAEVTAGQVGHAHQFLCNARPYYFRSVIIHDDHKPLEDWVRAQVKYSAQEFHRTIAPAARGRDRLRATALMPALAGVLAYLRAGGPFGGRTAYCYALERLTFESLLAMRVVRSKLETDQEKK